METALIAKAFVEIAAAAGVLVAVLLFLKDRRDARRHSLADDAAGLKDRAGERSAMVELATNHIEHSREAMECVADSIAEQAATTRELASAIRDMGNRCPCGHSDTGA